MVICRSFSEESKAATAKKANAVFQIDVKGPDGAIKTWFIDLKNNADVVTSLVSTSCQVAYFVHIVL